MSENIDIDIDNENVNNSPRSSFDAIRTKYQFEKLVKSEKELSWTIPQEKLLSEWAEKSAGYRWLHLRSHEMYSKYNNYLAYPIMFLSCIVGVGGLSSISKDKPTLTELYFQYLFFSCNIFISMLSSVQRFNNFMEESEKHSQAAIHYSKFYRNLNMELSMKRSDRQEFGVDFCKIAKTEFDRLLTTSPEIPVCIINDFNFKFKHVRNKPDVANGLTHLEHDMNI